MCLCLLLSFPILSLFEPILLLLFTRSIRLGRTSFLLVLVSRRLISRVGLLLLWRSLIRVVLVPPLIVVWRTVTDNKLKHRVCLKCGLNPSFPDGIIGLSFEDRDSLHDGGVDLQFGGCGKSGHFCYRRLEEI